MSMSNLTTPREIDMALAAKHHELDRANQQIAYSNGDMFSYSGGKSGYLRRKRAYFHTARTDEAKQGHVMTLAEATELTRANVIALKEYMEANQYTDGDYTGVKWDGWKGAIATHEARRAVEVFAKLAERTAVAEDIKAEIEALEDLYTGWSRFFVVTSSSGHIHSSMHCSTCYHTTTYGWLPELSGKTEAEAVEAHGPALCSVCFPSAPVDMVGGKITKAQAAKKAA
jgi:hypothetical protein